jgi:hypothetical protein
MICNTDQIDQCNYHFRGVLVFFSAYSFFLIETRDRTSSQCDWQVHRSAEQRRAVVLSTFLVIPLLTPPGLSHLLITLDTCDNPTFIVGQHGERKGRFGTLTGTSAHVIPEILFYVLSGRPVMTNLSK